MPTEGENSEKTLALAGLPVTSCSAFFFCGEVMLTNGLQDSVRLVSGFWVFVVGVIGVAILFPSQFRYLSSRLLLIIAHSGKPCCYAITFLALLPEFSKLLCKRAVIRLHILKLRFKLLIGRLRLRYLLLKEFSVVHKGRMKEFDLPNADVLARGESATLITTKP